MSELIVGVRNDASGTSAIAGEVTGATRELAGQADGLRAAVDGFLQDVRAA